MTTFDAECFFGAVAGKMKTQLAEQHRAGKMPLFFLRSYAKLVRTRDPDIVIRMQSLARTALIEQHCDEQYNPAAVEVMLRQMESMLSELVEDLAAGHG